ncbi:aa3-type cytochrome c oxidase subunit IV [Pontibaca methylaminivorans]|nr:aa3-type cytochrome c oxidase subunit IV [Pontibaca methylaminivorans]
MAGPHGQMDIIEQERTFRGFVKWVVWSIILTALLLIFLAVFAA